MTYLWFYYLVAYALLELLNMHAVSGCILYTELSTESRHQTETHTRTRHCFQEACFCKGLIRSKTKHRSSCPDNSSETGIHKKEVERIAPSTPAQINTITNQPVVSLKVTVLYPPHLRSTLPWQPHHLPLQALPPSVPFLGQSLPPQHPSF